MMYGGGINIPGAPGNVGGMVAGSPGYFMGDQQVQDRLFKYGMQNTPRGQDIQRRIENIRQQYPNAFGPQASMYGALPGNAGNMAGIANAQFFGGPQMGQVPAGFVGKTVS